MRVGGKEGFPQIGEMVCEREKWGWEKEKGERDLSL